MGDALRSGFMYEKLGATEINKLFDLANFFSKDTDDFSNLIREDYNKDQKQHMERYANNLIWDKDDVLKYLSFLNQLTETFDID